MADKDPMSITVYVANLGKYNEGELVGGWIDLPVTDAALDKFLTEKVGLTLDAQAAFEAGQRGEDVYEEYAIHDVEYDNGLEALGYHPGEWDNLSDLNMLAKVAAVAQSESVNMDAVQAVIENESSLSLEELCNLLIQADEIPYYNFDLPGYFDVSDCSSPEEALGYTVANMSGLYQTLEEQDIENYFDFEAYGEAHSYDVTLCDEGYIADYEGLPSLDYYDRGELKEYAVENWDNYHDDDEPEREDEEPSHVAEKEFSLESEAADMREAAEALGSEGKDEQDVDRDVPDAR